jgi:hypothetical protein
MRAKERKSKLNNISQSNIKLPNTKFENGKSFLFFSKEVSIKSRVEWAVCVRENKENFNLIELIFASNILAKWENIIFPNRDVKKKKIR